MYFVILFFLILSVLYTYKLLISIHVLLYYLVVLFIFLYLFLLYKNNNLLYYNFFFISFFIVYFWSVFFYLSIDVMFCLTYYSYIIELSQLVREWFF